METNTTTGQQAQTSTERFNEDVDNIFGNQNGKDEQTRGSSNKGRGKNTRGRGRGRGGKRGGAKGKAVTRQATVLKKGKIRKPKNTETDDEDGEEEENEEEGEEELTEQEEGENGEGEGEEEGREEGKNGGKSEEEEERGEKGENENEEEEDVISLGKILHTLSINPSILPPCNHIQPITASHIYSSVITFHFNTASVTTRVERRDRSRKHAVATRVEQMI